MLYRYRKGGVIAREIVASRAQAPPTFCTEAEVAKGGAYLRDTTVHSHMYIHVHCSHTLDHPTHHTPHTTHHTPHREDASCLAFSALCNGVKFVLLTSSQAQAKAGGRGGGEDSEGTLPLFQQPAVHTFWTECSVSAHNGDAFRPLPLSSFHYFIPNQRNSILHSCSSSTNNER